MTKEDTSLPVVMGRLEIEPIKCSKNSDGKLQLKGNIFTRTYPHSLKCSCHLPKKSKHIIIKKKNTRILKEPVLKLLQSHRKDEIVKECHQSPHNILQCLSINQNPDNVNLSTLVDNQLKISAESTESNMNTIEQNSSSKWWKTDITHYRHKTDSTSEKNVAGSCSQQALNPPCDITIDELASYFETLVHIPRKMSSMAEMMYI